MTKKTMINVVGAEWRTVGDGKEVLNIKSEKRGYFTAFKEDWDNNPTPGVEPLSKAPLPIRVQVTYTEKPNPKNPKYPYKNVHAIDFLDVNSEYPAINPNPGLEERVKKLEKQVEELIEFVKQE